MADNSRLKYQDIPFEIDGVARIVKSVNKHTTCNDVISKLPNLQCPLAVFESVNGIEKELPGKTRLLKAWRAHGSSNRVVFVVKKSAATELKRSRSGLLREEKSKRRSTREGLKKVADLAFYVRYQKTKVQNMKRKLSAMNEQGSDEEAGGAEGGLRHFTSSSSVDSMDAFLAKADLDKMSRFLSFCGGVTEQHFGLKKVQKTSRDQEVHDADALNDDVKKSGKNVIQSSLRSMKLGFKQKFSSKSKAATRTTSAGTISSTDSGYKSATNETAEQEAKRRKIGLPKKHTFVDADNAGDFPRHSTPVTTRTYFRTQHTEQNKSIDEENDPFNLTFDELEGKNAILKKFMADQQQMTAGRVSLGAYAASELEVTDRAPRFSLPAFRSQKERCRYLWDMYCDSDSDSSSIADNDNNNVWGIASRLDDAFLDSTVTMLSPDATPRNRTLRRESAISNLTKFSLRTKPINIADDDDSFDYSFDCTFPRMDESQCMEFTTCFDQTLDQQSEDHKASFDVISDCDVTGELLKDMCDESFVESDEGLGSMSSGSVQNIVYI